jgi:hypothetical protein
MSNEKENLPIDNYPVLKSTYIKLMVSVQRRFKELGIPRDQQKLEIPASDYIQLAADDDFFDNPYLQISGVYLCPIQ